MKNIIHDLKNGRLFRLAAFLAVFSLINVFPMRGPMSKEEKARVIQYKQRLAAEEQRLAAEIQQKKLLRQGLLVFLDDSEKDDFGAISSRLLIALHQEAGPIIVSTSLLYNVLKPKNGRGYDSLLSRIAFLPERWIIKKVNNSLNLLIPQVYWEGFKIAKDKVKAFDNAASVISDVELQLGLKVNHMETVNYETIVSPNSMYQRFYSYSLSYFVKPSAPELADYFNDSLDTIFCKKSDYDKRNINIPEWFVYITGHGGLGYSITHLSLEDFKKLLSFLDTKINTKLLVVSSCYAAGFNADEVHGDIKLGKQQYYSFPIIIQSLNDVAMSAKVFKGHKTAYIDAVSFLEKKEGVDFVSFFKKAKNLEGDYSEVIKPISENFIRNIPQIKLPGIEWFSVIEGDKKIVSIGSILVKARDPQGSLDVVNFFKKDPELILLYTDNIPFELVINSSNLKAIVSMVSVKKLEKNLLAPSIRIKKISSTQSFNDILYWFIGISKSDFFIDEIDEYKDIAIVTTQDGVRVYYKDKNDVLFTGKLTRQNILEGLKEIKTEKVERGSDYEKNYENKVRTIRNEYPQWSVAVSKARQEITPEQIEKIKNVLIKQREQQKHQK